MDGDIFSKPEEKIVVKKERVMVKEKKKKIDLSGLDNDEKEVVRLLESESGGMFQADLMEKLDIGKVKQAGVDAVGAKRAYLCKQHYKDYKKGNKKSSQLERWRHTG